MFSRLGMLVFLTRKCFAAERCLHVIHTKCVLLLNNSLLKFATKDSTLADGVDSSQAPEKDLLEKEKATLKKLLPLAEKFVHEKVDLQVS